MLNCDPYCAVVENRTGFDELRQAGLIGLLILVVCLHLSSVWSGVDLRMDTNKKLKFC